jgi:DNA-binding MarR family transcriptional regulator
MDIFASEANYGFLIEVTMKKIKQRLQRKFNEIDIDLTVDQWVILDILNTEDGISQQEIGKVCFKDAPTLTRILDLMVRKELIERNTQTSDRRKFEIRLTAKGLETFNTTAPLVQQLRAEGRADLSEQDMHDLFRILRHINSNIERQA